MHGHEGIVIYVLFIIDGKNTEASYRDFHELHFIELINNTVDLKA